MIVHISRRGDCAPPGVSDDDRDTFCCMGAIDDGPRGCTCWTTVFAVEQSDALQEGPAERLTKCCGDCAYRQGSPERACGELPMLLELAQGDRPFYCHQGMRRAIAYMHPDGRVLPGDPADYRPAQRPERAWRADGRPAQVCAGWGALAAGAAPLTAAVSRGA